jgi:eukaryotic-like serine/threonine-protein kinase
MTDGTVRALVRTPAVETNATISPDGRWLAFASNESGRFEVYVQRFPSPTRKWPV